MNIRMLRQGRMLKKGVTLVCVLTLSAGLSGCLWRSKTPEPVRDYVKPRPDQPPQPPQVPAMRVDIEDVSLGAPREIDQLGSRAYDDWQAAFASALATPWNRTERDWTARDGVTGGSITVQDSYLVGVEAARGGRLPAPAGLLTGFTLDPVTGPYKAVSNANVRLGPDTANAKIGRVDAGDRVEVHGRVRGKDWFLVAQRGEALGYIFADLLEPVSTDDFDLALAGGRPRKPVMCLDFRQTLRTARGRTANWNGIACRIENRRWRVVKDVVGVSS